MTTSLLVYQRIYNLTNSSKFEHVYCVNEWITTSTVSFQMLDISEMPPTGREAKRRKKLEGLCDLFNFYIKLQSIC